jgi:hypothetical protein
VLEHAFRVVPLESLQIEVEVEQELVVLRIHFRFILCDYCLLGYDVLLRSVQEIFI